MQLWPEGFERNQCRNRYKRIVLFGEAFVASVQIEEAKQVRAAEMPDETLLEFLQSTYEAAADFGNWHRAALECPLGEAGVPRAVS